MRKLGVVILVLVTLVGVLGWHWFVQPLRPPSIIGQSSLAGTAAIADLIALETTDFAAVQVNSSRLLADVAALSFIRHSPAERDRARQYITTALQQAGWTVQARPYTDGSFSGINLVAERAGTDPSAGVLLLGAHYDSVERSPGADDNATAVATVLEAARLFANLPTPRTLQLVLFDQEEVGLVGSKQFVEQMGDRPSFSGAVILEMLGYGCDQPGCQTYPDLLPITPPTDRGNFIAVIGDQGHQPLIDAFSRSQTADLTPVLTLALPLLGPLTPDLLRSDHTPFWKRGIGAVMVTDTANFRNPHYHQPSDTMENLNQEFLLDTAQVVMRAIARLLTQPGSLATGR